MHPSRRHRPDAALLALVLTLALAPAGDALSAPRRAAAPAWTAERLNDPALQGGVLRQGMQGAAVLRAHILLDRSWFSVGEMDGRFGANMTRIVRAFQAAQGLTVTGRIDAATWARLEGDAKEAVVVPYTVTAKDAAGPFVAEIPTDMLERSKLPALGYTSLEELLGEKFHIAPAALKRLNPGVQLVAGAEIQVPAVADTSAKAPGKAQSILIDKSERVLMLRDAGGATLAAFPVSFGGANDPLPIGEMALKNEVRNPDFTYNPKLMWNAKPDEKVVRIAPGPNNPVGTIWMGLSKPHWGMHGTPIPGHVGHDESNGCIHLTNWDAERVSSLVKAGFKVEVQP